MTPPHNEFLALADRISGHLCPFKFITRDEREMVVSALRLASQLSDAAAMKVKELEWADPAEPNDACPYDHVTAESAFGQYLIEWKGWKDYSSFTVNCDHGNFAGAAYTLDEAKAVAQADYERRIRSAIDAITVAPPAGDAVREALERIRDFPHSGSPSEQAMSGLARAALGREDKAGVICTCTECIDTADADHTPHAFVETGFNTCKHCGNGKEHPVHPSEPTAASAQEVVGWMAFCPDTGGRCVEHTEDAAKYHGAICYAPDHDFIVVPLYTRPAAKPDVEATKALTNIRDSYGPNHDSKYCRDVAATAIAGLLAGER